MNRESQIFFPFIEYEQKIHLQESAYSQWQMHCAVYDPAGKVCAVPYEAAKPYLKHSIDWMWYLIDAPGEYRRCDFSAFSDLERYFLLRMKVELRFFIPWRSMDPEYQDLLLAYHPALAQDAGELQALSGNHWQKILQCHPEYKLVCPWEKLSGDNLQVILTEHPELAAYCDFSRLTLENWGGLLKMQIRFLPLCPQKIRMAFPDELKKELFFIYPEIRKLE